MKRHLGAVALLAAVALLGGCRTSGVTPESGPGSLRDVRRQLDGEWALQRFERAEAGRWVGTIASGRLTYDGFGNLVSEGRLQNQSEAEPLLTYRGRATVDVASGTLSVRDSDDAGVPVRLRTFELQRADQLVVTIQDAAGVDTARATWRRVPRTQ